MTGQLCPIIDLSAKQKRGLVVALYHHYDLRNAELASKCLRVWLSVTVDPRPCLQQRGQVRLTFGLHLFKVRAFPNQGVGIEFTGELSHHFERGFPSQQMMRFMRALHKAWPYSGAYIGCIEWFSLLYLSHARSAQVVYRAGEDHSLVATSLKDAILLQATLEVGINTLARQVKLKADDK